MADREVDVLLIGGGVASANAAAELRACGFDGSVLLATREQDPPYHRPPITKDYLQGRTRRDEAQVLPSDWWEQHKVELRLRTPVSSLDVEGRTATVGRKQVAFRHALLATGAMVRRLQVDGAQLEGIRYLRALGNADALRAEALDAKRVTVVGGSYIGAEVAASLASMGISCTLVMQERLPLERTLGRRIGRVVGDELAARGVEVRAADPLVRFEGREHVEAVITATGARVPSDVVVVGAGSIPDSSLARRAGLSLAEDGGVRCDATLRTSSPYVFAAGDVCEFDSPINGAPVRIEHEEVAAAQGRLAARNMLGSAESFAEVPYFWSDLADWLSLEYVGFGDAWDDEQIVAWSHQRCFGVRYMREGRLVGVCSVGDALDLDDARAALGPGRGHRACQPAGCLVAR